MDLILLIFGETGCLVKQALCFEEHDRASALQAYADLSVEVRPLLYRATLIEPIDLLKPGESPSVEIKPGGQ